MNELARTVAERKGLQVCAVRSDYEASAEVLRDRPDTVLIDMKTCSDPLGLCRWIRSTTEDVTMILIGEGEEEDPPVAAGAHACVGDNALARLEGQIVELLERAE